MERQRDAKNQDLRLADLEREERELHHQREQMLANLQAISGALQLIAKLKTKMGETHE